MSLPALRAGVGGQGRLRGLESLFRVSYSKRFREDAVLRSQALYRFCGFELSCLGLIDSARAGSTRWTGFSRARKASEGVARGESLRDRWRTLSFDVLNQVPAADDQRIEPRFERPLECPVLDLDGHVAGVADVAQGTEE